MFYDMKRTYISPSCSESVLDYGVTILVSSYGLQDYKVDSFDYDSMVFKQE